MRPSWVLSPSLMDGVSSSDGSVALFREPTFSSSVLPIVIGEVGDSVTWPWLAGTGTSLGGTASSLSSELVSVRLISARAALFCVLCEWVASAEGGIPAGSAQYLVE